MAKQGKSEKSKKFHGKAEKSAAWNSRDPLGGEGKSPHHKGKALDQKYFN